MEAQVPSMLAATKLWPKTTMLDARQDVNEHSQTPSSTSSSRNSEGDDREPKAVAVKTANNNNHQRRPLKKRAAARQRYVSCSPHTPPLPVQTKAGLVGDPCMIKESKTNQIHSTNRQMGSFTIDSILAGDNSLAAVSPPSVPASATLWQPPPSSIIKPFSLPAAPLQTPLLLPPFDFSAAIAAASAALPIGHQANAASVPLGVAAAAAQWLRFATPMCAVPFFASALAAHQQQQQQQHQHPWPAFLPTRLVVPTTVVASGDTRNLQTLSSLSPSLSPSNKQDGEAHFTAPVVPAFEAHGRNDFNDEINVHDDMSGDQESNLSDTASEQNFAGTLKHENAFCAANESKRTVDNKGKNLRSGSPLCALVEMTTKTLEEINEDAKRTNLKRTLGERSLAEAAKKKRKSRTAFTNPQVFELERRFSAIKYLNPGDRDDLAQRLGLTNAQVITWFQNRRAKYKRDMEELQKDVSAHNNSSLFFQQMFGAAFPPGPYPPPLALHPACSVNHSSAPMPSNNNNTSMLLPFFANLPPSSRSSDMQTTAGNKPSPVEETNIKREMKPLNASTPTSKVTATPLFSNQQQQNLFNLRRQAHGDNVNFGGPSCFQRFNPPSCTRRLLDTTTL